MGTGYVRNDTSNNIDDGGVIDAADLDGEFDAIVDAFVNTTGHTHDGTASEGGAVSFIGPAQEFQSDGTAFFPKTTATYTLGKSGATFSGLFVDGVTLGGTAITSTAAEINLLDGVTTSTAELNLLDGVTSSTVEINTLDGVTSSVQTQLDARQPLDGDLTAIAALSSSDSNFIVGSGSTWVVESGSTVRTSLGLGTSATTDSSEYATAGEGTLANNALPKGGGAMTGAITTNSTFDGRDVATDGTKLDTVETNANVTDTANVTSSGALMDSELTDISSIKALNQGVSTSDSPTFQVVVVNEVKAQDGSVGDASFTFTSDQTTGMYYAGLLTAFTNSGVQAAVIEAAGTTISGAKAIVTKEKGDARYIQDIPTSLNSVGTPAFLRLAVGDGNKVAGSTVAGSLLRYSSTSIYLSGTPSGTWRLMGYINNNDEIARSLFVRIS